MSGAMADPRIPGIRAAIKFYDGYVRRQGATDTGREMYHVLREMESWLESIEDGDED